MSVLPDSGPTGLTNVTAVFHAGMASVVRIMSPSTKELIAAARIAAAATPLGLLGSPRPSIDGLATATRAFRRSMVLAMTGSFRSDRWSDFVDECTEYAGD